MTVTIQLYESISLLTALCLSKNKHSDFNCLNDLLTSETVAHHINVMKLDWHTFTKKFCLP